MMTGNKSKLEKQRLEWLRKTTKRRLDKWGEGIITEVVLKRII